MAILRNRNFWRGLFLTSGSRRHVDCVAGRNQIAGRELYGVLPGLRNGLATSFGGKQPPDWSAVEAMAEPSSPEKDPLFSVIMSMMRALLEVNCELTNILSALSAQARGDSDAAEKGVAAAFEDATRFHVAMQGALDNLSEWTRTTHV